MTRPKLYTLEVVAIDDDGVQVRACADFKLIGYGLAMHRGLGQADTIRRALFDAIAHARGIK